MHFDTLAGCASHVKGGNPMGKFGARYAQVYGKIKVPFYNYQSKRRSGICITPVHIMNGNFNGFQVCATFQDQHHTDAHLTLLM